MYGVTEILLMVADMRELHSNLPLRERTCCKEGSELTASSHRSFRIPATFTLRPAGVRKPALSSLAKTFLELCYVV